MPDPDTRERARDLIGRTLAPRGGGGIAGAFQTLETRLRQPYASTLTDGDRASIREYINTRVDAIFELLDHSDPAIQWSDDSDGETADAGQISA